MIIIANADGSLPSVKPSSVYQGSNLANEIVFIGEFANGSTVTVAYQLPNGAYTEESYLNFLENIDNKYNVWIGKINGVVTEKSGLVTAQIFVYPGGYTKEGTYLSPRIATYSVTFNVNTGVLTDDKIEDISTIEELKNYLANILNNYNEFKENTNSILKIVPTNLRNGNGKNSLQLPKTDDVEYSSDYQSIDVTSEASGDGSISLSDKGKVERNHFMEIGNLNVAEYADGETPDEDDGGILVGYKHYTNSRGATLIGAWGRAINAQCAIVGGYSNTTTRKNKGKSNSFNMGSNNYLRGDIKDCILLGNNLITDETLNAQVHFGTYNKPGPDIIHSVGNGTGIGEYIVLETKPSYQDAIGHNELEKYNNSKEFKYYASNSKTSNKHADNILISAEMTEAVYNSYAYVKEYIILGRSNAFQVTVDGRAQLIQKEVDGVLIKKGDNDILVKKEILNITPLVVDEIVELPVDNQYVVVGYKNSIDLASLNYTPKPGDEFFGLFKSNDSYVYGAVAKIIDEDFSDGFASFELIEVCLIHDPVPVIEVDSELSIESENPVQNKVVTEAINSSHVVNVTQMSTIYDNESELPSLGASGNGACYLVKTNGKLPLVLYSYNASANKWVKKFEVKPSTLYLNLEDGSLYRYTNNPNTIPYSNFIKITLSPEVIESKIGDIELALDSIIEIQNSLIGGAK